MDTQQAAARTGLDVANAAKANEALGIICEISNILGTGLDRETLSVLVGLLESGINPEALATVVKELRREVRTQRGLAWLILTAS